VAHSLAHVSGEDAALREQCAGRDDEGGLADRAACDQEDSEDQSEVEHWNAHAKLAGAVPVGGRCSSLITYSYTVVE
jgi:hypothetical protein